MSWWPPHCDELRVTIHLMHGTCMKRVEPRWVAVDGVAVFGPQARCVCALTGLNNRLRVRLAREAWAAHRDDILQVWRFPFPCFAQVVLDGETFPRVKPHWSATAKGMHALLAEEIGYHQHGVKFLRERKSR